MPGSVGGALPAAAPYPDCCFHEGGAFLIGEFEFLSTFKWAEIFGADPFLSLIEGESTLWWYAGVLLLLFLVWLFRPVSKERPWRVKPRPLLTENELDFCQRLEAGLPEYRILAQVSMGALMEPDLSEEEGGEPGRFLSVRGRFAQKVVDFVVVDAAYRVLALVELDDSTHDAQKDAERDRITEMAGYLTIRYDSRQKPSPDEIRDDFIREGLL